MIQPSPHLVCPSCGQTSDDLLAEFPGVIGERVTDLVHDELPAWQPSDGLCVACADRYLQRALQQLARENAWSELNEYRELVYDSNLSHIIPTPTRVHANPNYTGRGVTIAFIDSGFFPHPDLTQPQDRILRYVDVTDAASIGETDFSRPDVTSWHGMMTSVSATGNGHLSGGLYRGIASDANVVLVRVSDPFTHRITEEAIYRGLAWVIANQTRYDIKVVNISLGGDHDPTPGNRLDRKANEAVQRGMIVVVAAGNSGIRRLVPPASADRVITVGGLDDQNTLVRAQHRMYWSNWDDQRKHAKPELIAPSIWVAAPILPGTRVHAEAIALHRLMFVPDAELRVEVRQAPRWLGLETFVSSPLAVLRDAIRNKFTAANLISAHYKHVDGTSFAAPIVSSVVAQMLEANPSLTPEAVKRILIETANPLPHVPPERQGYGVVNPSRAVAAVLRRGVGPLSRRPVSPWVRKGRVVFTYQNPAVRRVTLVASFTLWNHNGPEFTEEAPGVWTLSIAAPPPGRYAYKFMLDGDEMVPDPENGFQVPDGYGGWNTVLTVPRQTR
ncbi:MAG: S8 family serine peptidase [Anaerolineae bacterium]|nr:S8 family serine peptidase [Anaerolineae bacterium]